MQDPKNPPRATSRFACPSSGSLYALYGAILFLIFLFSAISGGPYTPWSYEELDYKENGVKVLDRLVLEESLKVSNLRGGSENLVHLVNDLSVAFILINVGVLFGVYDKFEEDSLIFVINMFWDHIVLSFARVSGEELFNVSSKG